MNINTIQACKTIRTYHIKEKNMKTYSFKSTVATNLFLLS